MLPRTAALSVSAARRCRLSMLPVARSSAAGPRPPCWTRRSPPGAAGCWATVRSWNAASFRVLEKLGFERSHSTWDEHGEIVWNVREL